MNWQLQQVEIYRKQQVLLKLNLTLFPADALISPLLPDFACPISRFFD
ncbi:hypothetical protein [Leptolyngbya sp. 'hensonii']|nr:hypothetical protein [Leptolyngbya sp. 'hensonii']